MRRRDKFGRCVNVQEYIYIRNIRSERQVMEGGVGSWRLSEENITKQLLAAHLVAFGSAPDSFTHPPSLLPRTPLHYAAANGSYQCAVTLVTAGAGVNEADCKGCSPLHYAAASDTYRR